MALTQYNKKRDFKKTPEPEGKSAAKKGKLIFTVQKHHASHLHYDFRLEMEGVLKSWAVPKGPSMNPEDKRLAMMVEDHPYDYKDFEGNIPQGNYGGGNVIVWDNGTYSLNAPYGSKADEERDLLAALRKGHLNFVLHGKKLKGEFDLIKLKNGKQENAWLLIKKNDKYAGTEDVTKKDKSVISKVTLEALAKKYHNGKDGVRKDPAKAKGTKSKGSAPKVKTKRKTASFKKKARI